MTKEDLKIMQARLESKGIPQSPVKSEINKRTMAGVVRNARLATGHSVQSKPEQKFYDLWKASGGPPLAREHLFFLGRRWRADFAHVGSSTLIEIDGAVWGTKSGHPGGHARAGKIRDCERDLECVLNGWRVIRLVPSMITVETVERLIAFVRG
jgi:hypothetical protein